MPFSLARTLSQFAATLALLVAAPPALNPATQVSLTITFLANEGVLLSSGTKQVLIDALFQKYETGYATPHDSTRAALEGARAPFNDVDLVLVTHRHGDHFHPASVASHLLANSGATLLTSKQVIDSMRGRISAGVDLSPRIMARTMSHGARRREVVNGISVELLGLPHTGLRNRFIVEHLGYIVELGGRRILHVGDANFAEDEIATFRLDTARIDIARIPNWLVTSEEGRRVIEKWIRPKQVVAVHVGEGREEATAQEVQAAMPSAITFRRSLESRTW